jgi:DNA primase
LKSGFEVRAAILPKGEDPDTAVRKMGSEQFQHHISQAPSLLDFIRDRIVEQYDLSQIDQQIACVKQILPTIAKIKDITERSIQINKTAELLKATDFLKVTDKSYLEGSILEEFRKIMMTGKSRITKPIPKKQIVLPPSDRYFIKALLKDKSLIHHIKGELNPEDLSHPLTQKVVRELFIYNDKTDFEARTLDAFSDTEYQDYLSKLFMEIDEVVDPKVTVRDYLYHLRQKDFEQKTLDITRKVKTAQEKKNKEVLDTFLEQKNKDLQEKKNNFKKK